MRWSVETVTFLQPPMTVGQVYSNRHGMKPEMVTVECKADAHGAHPRNGWRIWGDSRSEAIDIAATNEDMAAGAPETGLVAGAAQRGQMQRIQFAKNVIVKNISRLAEPVAETAIEPEPTPKMPAPEIDISMPLTRGQLDSLKFFTLQKHVQKLTGLKPANKEVALKLLADGNLIAESGNAI